jgi:hypothetical protein
LLFAEETFDQFRTIDANMGRDVREDRRKRSDP